MAWIVIDVVLAVTGLVVLAVLGWRLLRQVQALGREVRVAGERIQTVTAALDERRGGPDPGLPTASSGRLT